MNIFISGGCKNGKSYYAQKLARDMAAKAGLPDKIIHLIATHSFEGERSYQTAESAFVRAIDDFVFKCTVYGLKQGPVG